MTREAADVVRGYLAAFGRREPDEIAGHVSDGFVNEHTSALGGGCVGRDEYRRRLPGFLQTFDGLRYDVLRLIADGNSVAAEYRLRATVDGHDIDLRGVMTFDVDAGLIARRTDYWDSLTFLRQTGQQ